MVSLVLTVNVGTLQPGLDPRKGRPTGIGKHPHTGPVAVRAPGPKRGGLGSGLVGDAIGDERHHGGDSQAVYAFAREELDEWEDRLDRALPNGFFGENLTTRGVVVSDAVIGERWRIGETVVLQVAGPRIPCGTFRAQMGERGWLKTFTQAGRSGAYLSVVTPGEIQAGDPVEVLHRPDHGVLVSTAFRAMTLERDLLPGLLAAGDDLEDELRELAAESRTSALS